MFDFQSDADLPAEPGDPAERFLNAGTLKKTLGSSTSSLSMQLENSGLVQAGSGALSADGTFTNWSAGTKSLSGGTYVVSATFRFTGADIVTNAATVVLDGPASAVTDAGGQNAFRNFATNAAAGSLTIKGGRTLTAPAAFQNAGLMSVEDASTFGSIGALTNTGTVEGTGTVAANVTNNGTFAPGLSPGILHVDGPYSTDSGTLDVEIGGLTPGTGHDQLDVTGPVTLGGTLEITTLPGFTPAEGDSFTIVKGSSVSGSFDDVVGAEVGAGLRYTVQTTASTVVLTVASRALSIGNAVADEGGGAVFTVSLTPPDPDNTVTVSYATSGGTATQGVDYEGQLGLLTFAPNEATKTITVPTIEDALDEDDETFSVVLLNPGGAPIADDTGEGTITDDDAEPELSIVEVAPVTEGDPGDTPNAEFSVSLSAESGRTVTVDVETAPGTATEDVDYDHTTEALTFLPGETNLTFLVPVNGDDLVEGDETFDAVLSNPTNATIEDDVATGTIEDDDATSNADLMLSKFDLADPVGVGGELRYSIDAFNGGPGAATDVEITDDLPSGVTLVSATPSSGGTCNSIDPVVCSWATLDLFSSAHVEIVATAPLTPTVLSNTATVVSPDDSNTANNTATEETTVAELADLALVKTADPPEGTVGAPLTYTLAVTNNGPAAATGVTVTDLLPENFTATSMSPECTLVDGTATCELGTIANGATAVVEIEGTPTAGGTLNNSASAQADETDPNSGNNSDFLVTPVRWQHDLAVTKTDSVDPINVGDQVTYTITVTNVGALPLTGVVATDTLPAGMTFVSGPGCSPAGSLVTCTIGALAPDEVKQATLVVEATTPLLKTNSVTVTAAEGDDFTDDNTATQTTRVRDSALEIARAMIEDESWLAGASFVAIPPQGNPNMVARSPLAGFPRHGETFALLTSGDAELADDPNTAPNSGVDDGGPNVRGNTDRDVTILKVDLDVPAGFNCASVNFRFGSDEYPEFKGTQFNDAFIAELDTSTWTTSGSVITAANNFAFDPANNPITINAAGFTSMTEANAAGTTYDGATPLLSASQSITPGVHSLYFSIFDQGDGIYDSAVLLDRLRLSSVAPGACTPGATILAATKTADAPRSAAGAANGYTISIANPHTEPFTIAEIADDLPAGFTYTPGTTTGATTADPTIVAGRLTWTGPFTLPAGETLTLHFGVTVATAPGDYLNEASALSERRLDHAHGADREDHGPADALGRQRNRDRGQRGDDRRDVHRPAERAERGNHLRRLRHRGRDAQRHPSRTRRPAPGSSAGRARSSSSDGCRTGSPA